MSKRAADRSGVGQLVGVPVARIVPVTAPPPGELGFVVGSVPDAFFEPLSEQELARWE